MGPKIKEDYRYYSEYGKRKETKISRDTRALQKV